MGQTHEKIFVISVYLKSRINFFHPINFSHDGYLLDKCTISSYSGLPILEFKCVFCSDEYNGKVHCKCLFFSYTLTVGFSGTSTELQLPAFVYHGPAVTIHTWETCRLLGVRDSVCRLEKVLHLDTLFPWKSLSYNIVSLEKQVLSSSGNQKARKSSPRCQDQDHGGMEGPTPCSGAMTGTGPLMAAERTVVRVSVHPQTPRNQVVPFGTCLWLFGHMLKKLSWNFWQVSKLLAVARIAVTPFLWLFLEIRI